MDSVQLPWRGLPELGPWFVLEPLLPGAALFLLLLSLSYRFVLVGFGAVRQYALAPDGGKWSLNVTVRRSWWNCTCASRALCECRTVLASGLRRWCGVVLQKPALRA